MLYQFIKELTLNNITQSTFINKKADSSETYFFVSVDMVLGFI